MVVGRVGSHPLQMTLLKDDASQLGFALWVLGRCGRRSYNSWLRLGFLPVLCEARKLPPDAEDLIVQFLR